MDNDINQFVTKIKEPIDQFYSEQLSGLERFGGKRVVIKTITSGSWEGILKSYDPFFVTIERDNKEEQRIIGDDIEYIKLIEEENDGAQDSSK